MGPIQSGINQIIQSALHNTLAFKLASGAEAQRDIKKYITGVSEKNLSPEELYKRQKNAPKVSKRQINKYFKDNPEEAKKMSKAAISVPANKADAIKNQLAELDAERESIMSNLPTYTPVSASTESTPLLPASESTPLLPASESTPLLPASASIPLLPSPASSSLAETSAKRLSQINKFEALKNELKQGEDPENG